MHTGANISEVERLRMAVTRREWKAAVKRALKKQTFTAEELKLSIEQIETGIAAH